MCNRSPIFTPRQKGSSSISFLPRIFPDSRAKTGAYCIPPARIASVFLSPESNANLLECSIWRFAVQRGQCYLPCEVHSPLIHLRFCCAVLCLLRLHHCLHHHEVIHRLRCHCSGLPLSKSEKAAYRARFYADETTKTVKQKKQEVKSFEASQSWYLRGGTASDTGRSHQVQVKSTLPRLVRINPV